LTTKGDWAKAFINGQDLTADMMNINYQHLFTANPVAAQNVGANQFAVGAFAPKLALSGYRKGAQGNVQTAHNLLAQAAGANVGGAVDLEFIISIMLGNNASPVAGDMAIMMDASLLNYDAPAMTPAGLLMFNAAFSGRGKRAPLANIMIDQPPTLTGTITSVPFDRGAAAAAGTLLGGVAQLQSIAPSALYAVGTVQITPAIPTDGDTVVVNGQTFTFKTALTPTAGQVLIGATPAAAALNLYQAMIGSIVGRGTAYATGTVPVPTASILISKPSLTNVITLTAAVPGVAGNALTLTKTGTNTVVSGATLTGGTAGDSYAITVASATTSGGSYTTHLTFVSTLQAQGAERLEIPIGTLINRWIKITATTVGSTSKPAFNVLYGSFWQL